MINSIIWMITLLKMKLKNISKKNSFLVLANGKIVDMKLILVHFLKELLKYCNRLVLLNKKKQFQILIFYYYSLQKLMIMK